MKLALLLPAYLDSPRYQHMKIFDDALTKMGYVVTPVDPCRLWETNDVNNYTITNYIKQVRDTVMQFAASTPEEIVLVGHSLGAFVAIVAGARIDKVTRIVALCPAPDRASASLQWNCNMPRHSVRELPDNPQQTRSFDIPYAFVEDGLQYSAVQDVEKIHKPLMIFMAMDDEVVSPSETERIVQKANNPYVIRQPHMGHDFRYDKKQCEVVMEHIRKFLLLPV